MGKTFVSEEEKNAYYAKKAIEAEAEAKKNIKALFKEHQFERVNLAPVDSTTGLSMYARIFKNKESYLDPDFDLHHLGVKFGDYIQSEHIPSNHKILVLIMEFERLSHSPFFWSYKKLARLFNKIGKYETVLEPILDKNGKKMYDKNKTIKKVKLECVLDGEGKKILNTNGKPLMQPARDKDGKKIYIEEAKPLMRAKMEYVLNEKGERILTTDGTYLMQPVKKLSHNWIGINTIESDIKRLAARGLIKVRLKKKKDPDSSEPHIFRKIYPNYTNIYPYLNIYLKEEDDYKALPARGWERKLVRNKFYWLKNYITEKFNSLSDKLKKLIKSKTGLYKTYISLQHEALFPNTVNKYYNEKSKSRKNNPEEDDKVFLEWFDGIDYITSKTHSRELSEETKETLDKIYNTIPGSIYSPPEDIPSGINLDKLYNSRTGEIIHLLEVEKLIYNSFNNKDKILFLEMRMNYDSKGYIDRFKATFPEEYEFYKDFKEGECEVNKEDLENFKASKRELAFY